MSEKVFTIIFPTEQLFRLNKTKLWPANSTKGEHHARMSLVLILAHFMQLMDLAAGALAAGARRVAPRHRGRARSAEASMSTSPRSRPGKLVELNVLGVLSSPRIRSAVHSAPIPRAASSPMLPAPAHNPRRAPAW